MADKTITEIATARAAEIFRQHAENCRAEADRQSRMLEITKNSAERKSRLRRLDDMADRAQAWSDMADEMDRLGGRK